jgi:hypothetical protein
MLWIKTILNKVLSTAKLPKKQKEFGYLVLVVFLIALGLSFYKHGFVSNANQIYLTISLGLILFITFTIRCILLPFLILWLLFGELLGIITSFVIMSVVYFILFSPIAIVLRLFRKEKVYKPEWKIVSRKIDYKKLS